MMASTDTATEVHPSFDTTGKRLTHILDKAGFKQGRGRNQHFQALLRDRRPDLFTDVSFNTIRSWFRDHAPHISKIEAVVQILHEDCRFEHDLGLIASWWKLGGFYPFSDKAISARSESLAPTVANSQTLAPNSEKGVYEDPIFISQIILLIEDVRQNLGIQLSTAQSAVISGRIIAFCTKNQLDAESDYLKEQISRMLHLARDGLI